MKKCRLCGIQKEITDFYLAPYKPKKSERKRRSECIKCFNNISTENFHKKRNPVGCVTLLDNEIWKTVDGYDNKYSVSNHGRVKRLIVAKFGEHSRIIKERLLCPVRCKKIGYESINLFYSRKKYDRIKIHRLVAMLFIENNLNKEFVNHINGIKHDNRVENLEWVTRSENSKHSFHILNNKSILNTSRNSKNKKS